MKSYGKGVQQCTKIFRKGHCKFVNPNLGAKLNRCTFETFQKAMSSISDNNIKSNNCNGIAASLTTKW